MAWFREVSGRCGLWLMVGRFTQRLTWPVIISKPWIVEDLDEERIEPKSLEVVLDFWQLLGAALEQEDLI